MMAQWQNPDDKNSGIPDWLTTALGVGGGLGAAAGGAYKTFGKGGKNPADVANAELDQIPGKTQQYYQPYQEAGLGALNTLQGQYGDLLNGNKQNQLGANYKESPGYKYALQQALQGGNSAAAAGGALGTPQHFEQNANLAGDIASKDYDNYIKNQLGLYGQGLEGEQGLNKQGFEANKDYADMLANIQAQKAGYGYAGQAGENKEKAGGLSDIFSGIGTAAASYLGGPVGGTAFKSVYDKIFGGK